jgi:hypothetical protein
MPANRERIAFRERAFGVETIYMTGRMRMTRKTRAAAKRSAVLLQALD